MVTLYQDRSSHHDASKTIAHMLDGEVLISLYIYIEFEDLIKNDEALLAICGIATTFYRTIMSLLNRKFIQKS